MSRALVLPRLSRAITLLAVLLLQACGAPATSGSEVRARPAPPTPAPSLIEPLVRESGGEALEHGSDDASSGGTAAEPDALASAPGTPVTPGPSETAASQTDDADASVPLAWVAGGPISAEDLLLEWHGVSSQDLFLALEKLVTTRLAMAEASRVGLKLDPERVQLRTADEQRRLVQDLAERQVDLSVEEYVRTRLGITPEAYRSRLRLAAIRKMIAERVVRLWTYSGDWARVRMIVVPNESEMDLARADLAAGQSFAEVARARSVDDTNLDGGLVPFLVRQEGSALSVEAFQTEPGQVAGPVALSGHQVLLLVEELHSAQAGDWRTLGPIVEASLKEHVVADPEFVNWKLTMEQRYPIDIGPLRDLLGLDG